MDLNKLNAAFKTLDELDENDELAYEKAFLTFLSINHLPVFINTLPPCERLFRTRTSEEPGYFQQISDIAITPRQFVKDYARCNRPNQSIFYCSENRPTSYMELLEYWVESRTFGDRLKVTVGMWENNQPLNVIIVTTPDKHQRISRYDVIHGAAYDAHMQHKSNDEVNFSNAFFKYMFDRFRTPAKHDLRTYIITTAYSNVALSQAGDVANGISYPSVPYNGNGVNFALKESYFENNLVMLHALWSEFEVRKTAEGKHNFVEINLSETTKVDSASNKLHW
jgi:hypothetical protein